MVEERRVLEPPRLRGKPRVRDAEALEEAGAQHKLRREAQNARPCRVRDGDGVVEVVDGVERLAREDAAAGEVRQDGVQPGKDGLGQAGEADGLDERSEEHTSELQSRLHLVCRLLLEKKKKKH